MITQAGLKCARIRRTEGYSRSRFQLIHALHERLEHIVNYIEARGNLNIIILYVCVRRLCVCAAIGVRSVS